VTALEQHLGMTAEAATDRVFERARGYVEHETPSGAVEPLTRLAVMIETELAACGADVQRFDADGAGRNLLARVRGADENAAPIVVLAHIDTVHPTGTLAERPVRVDGGKAFGPGIYDMKTGLALVVDALAWLKEQGRTPRRPVHVVVTCDEEVGSHSSCNMILEQARRSAAVLVPEPCLPGGGVKTFRKGVATYRITARGRLAHAGIDGQLAVSASAELIHALHAAIGLADHARGTTVNVGILKGGTASNVVAAEAFAVVDVRLAEPAEGERIHAELVGMQARHPEAGLEVVRSENRPPLVRSDAVVSVYQHACNLASDFGVQLAEGGTGGGSDGSIAGSVGAAVLDGLGPQGGGAHAVDEHILLADLPFRLALMTRLLETL
jgi:glutamate carboxypeptidase